MSENHITALSKIKKAYRLLRGIIWASGLTLDELIKIEKAKDNLKEVIDNRKGEMLNNV